MKIGSLVECVDISNPRSKRAALPVLHKIYTVRAFIRKNGITGIYVEEIINERHPVHKMEIAYLITRFKEVMPPMDILEKIEGSIPASVTH